MIDREILERERTVTALSREEYRVDRQVAAGLWRSGPWDDEPDRHVWFAAAGLPCVAK